MLRGLWKSIEAYLNGDGKDEWDTCWLDILVDQVPICTTDKLLGVSQSSLLLIREPLLPPLLLPLMFLRARHSTNSLRGKFTRFPTSRQGDQTGFP